MTEHTPAPWFKSAYSDSQGFKIKPKNGRLIAIVKEQQTQRPYEAVHNACLIAAAPEMLETLNMIYHVVKYASLENEALSGDLYGDCTVYESQIEQVRKIIEKARGEHE